MRALKDAWLIQIEVTNVCPHRCSHCTRAVRHIRKPFFADIEYVEKALLSLKEWKRGVGCMGGEPILHPKFREICELYKKHLPKKRRGLWTSGGKKYNEEYKDLILDTFGIINFNDHYYHSYHQPLMVASEEIVKDERLRKILIDNCWLQRTWSPTITPRGGFFCEVAATLDLIFDGPGGYPLEPLWWNKSVEDMQDQVSRYCKYCSIPIPMETHIDTMETDYVSPGVARRLEEIRSPLARSGKLHIVDKQYTLKDFRDSFKFRKPQKYADYEPGHFWTRNSIEFNQKLRSFPYSLKSWLRLWVLRRFGI